MLDYADFEANRLSRMLASDPHAAATEMRGQLQQLDPVIASELVRKSFQDQIPGSFGVFSLQTVQTKAGVDDGYRELDVLTKDGAERVAELRVPPQPFPFLNRESSLQDVQLQVISPEFHPSILPIGLSGPNFGASTLPGLMLQTLFRPGNLMQLGLSSLFSPVQNQPKIWSARA